MKKLIILLISITAISCSKSSINDDCGCVKETYYIEQYTSTNPQGIPVLSFNEVTLSTENIECNDEAEQVSNGDGTYFNIICK